MEIKEMVERARKAQVIYDERFDQERVDQVIKVAARTIFDHAEELARLTIDETQMGVYEDKVAKNRNKSKGVWYNLKGKKSMGILSIDERTNLIEIAKPIGVVAGITPMTNPVERVRVDQRKTRLQHFPPPSSLLFSRAGLSVERGRGEALDHIRHNADEGPLIALARNDRPVETAAVLGVQLHFPVPLHKTLHGEIRVDPGDHNVAVPGLKKARDNEKTAGRDAGIHHGVAGHVNDKRVLGVRCEKVIEVERLMRVVICRGRETGLDA